MEFSSLLPIAVMLPLQQGLLQCLYSIPCAQDLQSDWFLMLIASKSRLLSRYTITVCVSVWCIVKVYSLLLARGYSVDFTQYTWS